MNFKKLKNRIKFLESENKFLGNENFNLRKNQYKLLDCYLNANDSIEFYKLFTGLVISFNIIGYLYNLVILI